MRCATCGKETKNPKFCSRSCAAISHNKTPGRRHMLPTGVCRICGASIKAGLAYCIQCRPLKHHYGDICTCIVCKKDYILRRGSSTTKCTTCRLNESRHMMRARAIEYTGCICASCGFDREHRIMEYHHRDPNEKDFAIGNSLTKSWSVIKGELDKCIVLCPNCHRTFHITGQFPKTGK